MHFWRCVKTTFQSCCQIQRKVKMGNLLIMRVLTNDSKPNSLKFIRSTFISSLLALAQCMLILMHADIPHVWACRKQNLTKNESKKMTM